MDLDAHGSDGRRRVAFTLGRPNDDTDYRSLAGFLAEGNPRQPHADWFFLGTSGVRPGGEVRDTTVVEVPVERAMIQASGKVVPLADTAKFPAKFPGTGMARVCGPEKLDMVVTDAPVDPATRSSLEEAGVEPVLAGKVQA
ncbi:DeoR/GlpR family transcriptional regulator of sugar metabolism [Streptomyces phaeoluteigriseus]